MPDSAPRSHAPTAPVPAELLAYPVVIELPVQWSDQDAIGHVNNTVPIRWFESARIAYLERDGMESRLQAAGVGPILAAVSCNFRRQLHYPDSVLVGIRIARIGRTSFEMEHVVWSRSLGAFSADGTSTCVVFDYRAGEPRPIPGELIAVAERLEGRSLPRRSSERV